ncbi:hypothetical protein [Actinoallomurus rhizosphaericola]|uniref:hypothetical protein n=1 Tax=Actinoallomurus rhizosphaericola TaxID=2952536 RepID=UPI0020904549|nr:hypothetical protein [Actinoallomurus rhizosphaericola]MCO5992728.1 hypothetical protein [Actinoallomurus rhizosphaericola]
MRILHGGAMLVSAAALAVCAGCGSSGGKTAASPSGSAGASGAGGFAAYAACLRRHGADIPTTRPSGRPSGTPGQRGGGFGRAFGNVSQAARDACQSLAPQGQRRGMQELQAFRSCLKDHGVTLPTPTPGAVRSPGANRTPGARPSPGMRYLGGLKTSDPKVAAALKTCKPLLPSFSPRPAAS